MSEHAPADCQGQCNAGRSPCPYRIPCWRAAEYECGMDDPDSLDIDPEEPDA